MLRDFAEYLLFRGYPNRRIGELFQAIPYIDMELLAKKVISLTSITELSIVAIKKIHYDQSLKIEISACITHLVKYLNYRGMLKYNKNEPICIIENNYSSYLEKYRLYANHTISNHHRVVHAFLVDIGYKNNSQSIGGISQIKIANYIKSIGKPIKQVSLSGKCSILRSFLHYIYLEGITKDDKSLYIDPIVILDRESKPRYLSWDKVVEFINSIDRNSPLGIRDYSIFLTMATYGLRGCEISDLTFDSINWNKMEIVVFQRKTTNNIILPLVKQVGDSIIEYINSSRPKTSCQYIYLKHIAPHGKINTNVIDHSFVHWVNEGKVNITFKGCHCLRHSVAMKLIRENTSIKTISDIMGHGNINTTLQYLNLDYNDLRDVSLELPLRNIEENSETNIINDTICNNIDLREVPLNLQDIEKL
jgi:site-specific recombinase XerD